MTLHSSIEHTRLAPDTTPAEVDALCDEANAHAFVGVCVGPGYVARVRQRLGASPVRIVTVVGFPLGHGDPAADAFAAARACELGAHEVDMVVPIGLAMTGDLGSVEAHVAKVRGAIPGAVLKVILETGFFAPGALETLAEACVRGGADYLKTSTGFGPRGASVEDVQLLARVAARASRRVAVKASGGIRTFEQASALLAAGAARLGTSRGVDIVRQAGQGT